MKQYININEFQDFILKYISEGKLYNHFITTDFFNHDGDMIEKYNAMLHGLVWAATLMTSSKISKYYIE